MRMLSENWPTMLAILLICSLASFVNHKFGIFVATLITLGSIALTIALAAGGVPGIEWFLLFGLGLFPGLAWSGFFTGRYFRRKSVAKIT